MGHLLVYTPEREHYVLNHVMWFKKKEDRKQRGVEAKLSSPGHLDSQTERNSSVH